MGLVCYGRDDPKGSTTTASQSPEEVRVTVGVRGNVPAASNDDGKLQRIINA